MSRFEKKELTIIEGVEVTQKGDLVLGKGHKGENNFLLPKEISMDIKDRVIRFSPKDKKENPNYSAKLGLSFRMIENLIIGISKGFSKKLEVNGVGYRWSVANSKLNMQLGFSHDIVYSIPEGVTIVAENNVLNISGVDKGLVSQVAANIRSYRPVEPYKGKGIKYFDEYVIRKVGKSGN